MKSFSLFFALCISILGTYTDIKYGKVNNKHLCAAFSVWCLFIIVGHLSVEQYEITYITLTNIVLSTATALFLYLKDIWAPGDAKLFIFTALVFPVDCYICKDGNIFPSLNLIIFSFSLGYIFLFVQSICKNKTSKGKEHKHFSPPTLKKWLFSVLSNMGLMSAIYYVFSIYLEEFYTANRSFITLLSVIGLSWLQRKARIVKCFAGIACLIAYVILMRSSFSQLFLTMIQSLLIALIIDMLNRKVTQNNYRELEGEQVRAGMILSYGTIYSMQKCIDQELPRVTTEDRKTRLSEPQAEAVKRWCKNAKRTVVIVETIPFAPFIAAAEFLEIIRFFLLGE